MSYNTSENTSLSSRRNFLKQGIASGIALGAASIPMLNAAPDAPKKKIKALFVTGGGYHDFTAQKTILTEGVSKLIDIEWTILHENNANTLKAALSKKGWADAYDVIVYNICHAEEKDVNYINEIVNVHKAGKPMVAIHCTMHSYHWRVNGGKKSKQDKEWNKLLGVVSLNHGPQGPAIAVKSADTKHLLKESSTTLRRFIQLLLFSLKAIMVRVNSLLSGLINTRKQMSSLLALAIITKQCKTLKCLRPLQTASYGQ